MDIQPIFRCSVGIDVHLALLCVLLVPKLLLGNPCLTSSSLFVDR